MCPYRPNERGFAIPRIGSELVGLSSEVGPQNWAPFPPRPKNLDCTVDLKTGLPSNAADHTSGVTYRTGKRVTEAG
jgi:hypothetical protein